MIDVNYRDLKYLVAVAEYKHFGQAATACHVSQPTLSMQLKKLEQELGLQIFERDNKNVLITKKGQQIIDHARRALTEMQQLATLAKNLTSPLSGPYQIGIIPTVAPYLLPTLMPIIQKKYPSLNLIITEAKTEDLIQQLKKNHCDAIIIALPTQANNFICLPLLSETFYCAVSKEHALAKHKTLKITDLNHQEILLLEEGHCLRDQALDICHQAKTSINETYRATSLATLVQLVAANKGITLLPKMAIQTVAHNAAVKIIPFVEPAPKRELAMLTRQQQPAQSIVSSIANFFI